MTDHEIANTFQPFSPLVEQAIRMGWNDMFQSVSIIGSVRKTERANIMHAAIRENLRRVCDRTDPFLVLHEEPDGQGLDYLVLDLDDKRVVVRWAKWDGTRINRNRTHRQADIQEQGLLAFHEEEEREKLPAVTVGYTIEDDYTEVGQPCWWLGRLVLLRERQNSTEFIHELAVYSHTDSRPNDETVPRIVARSDELKRIERLAKELRLQIA